MQLAGLVPTTPSSIACLSRVSEAERDLKAVRDQLRQHSTRRKHLEELCAQLEAPMPVGLPSQQQLLLLQQHQCMSQVRAWSVHFQVLQGLVALEKTKAACALVGASRCLWPYVTKLHACGITRPAAEHATGENTALEP
eukprot:129245-Pelagomonas_calceolata.AAC.3